MNTDRNLSLSEPMGQHQNLRTFFEFFAGGGMARAGLGRTWCCRFANDIDEKKAESYRANWGNEDLVVSDVANLVPAEIPEEADLAWASFPCQDLSLAGDYRGLDGQRSGSFWPFWKLMSALIGEHRGPRMIVLENVCGALTSHSSRDFAAIASAFSDADYRFGAMTIDARLWVPQSRPRLFVIGVRGDLTISEDLRGEPSGEWHSRALRMAQTLIPSNARSRWVWWNLPLPQQRTATFADIIEEIPQGTIWNTRQATDYLVSLMGPLHRKSSIWLLSSLNGLALASSVAFIAEHGEANSALRFDLTKSLGACVRRSADPRVRPSSLSSEDRCEAGSSPQGRLPG